MTTRITGPKKHRVQFLPRTPNGQWSIGLAVLAVVGTLAWQAFPVGAFAGFLAALAGGILALRAILRDEERAISVFLAIVPMLFVVWFLVAELLSAIGVLPEH